MPSKVRQRHLPAIRYKNGQDAESEEPTDDRPGDDGLMCNRARMAGEPTTIAERFGLQWLADRPMDNRFHPQELTPRSRAWIVREDARGRGLDVMAWDVLGGLAKWPMTNVRQLGLLQWRRLAEPVAQRCLIPLTEFCEWTPEAHDIGGGKPIKGEMWFSVTAPPGKAGVERSLQPCRR
jgi:putative SOS response-associated peptidase YedK